MSFSKICMWMIYQKAQTWQSFWGETFLQTPWWLTYYSECLAKCSVSPNALPELFRMSFFCYSTTMFLIAKTQFNFIFCICQRKVYGCIHFCWHFFLLIREFRALFKYLSLLGALWAIRVDLYLGKLFIWFSKPLCCSSDPWFSIEETLRKVDTSLKCTSLIGQLTGRQDDLETEV